MKKILFISHTLEIGGAELLLKNVVQHLLQEGYDSVVWGPYSGNLEDEYKKLNIPCIVRDFEVDRINRDQEIKISGDIRKKVLRLIDYCRKNNKKLAIRCAGTITKNILDEFDFSDIRIVGIFDNNKSLFGKDINGHKIYPASDFDSFDADVVLIAHSKPDFLKKEFALEKVKVISDLFNENPLKRFIKKITYLKQLGDPLAFFRKINPDMIFVNNARSFWAVIVGKLLGKKVIWNIHENYEPRTFRVFPQALYLHSLKLADRFIFPSKDCYSYYASFIPENKVCIIHGGINEDKIYSFKSSDQATITRKELNIPADHKVICNIGIMSEVKGQIYLINAAIKLLKFSPDKNLTFIIVGSKDNEYSNNIKNVISSSGFKENFRIIPATNEAYKFLNIADIYVCSSFMESFGLTILEAMAFRKPVIAANTGGIPEIITHNETGILIPLENMEDHIASNIELFINNPDLADNLSENAYKSCMEKLTIGKTLEKYSELVRCLL